MGFVKLLFRDLIVLLGGILLTSGLCDQSYAENREWIEAKRKAGQLMWVGFHDIKQLREIKASGVVFFGWNIKSARDLQSAVLAIRQMEATSFLPRSLTAMDHEGGRVMRLKSGLSHVPDAAALGATQDVELVKKISFLMARELKNIGVDINFAPVMDRGDARSFLENRVWSNDSGVLTQMTSAFLEGHLQGGTFPFPKHFPGHGPKAFQDAHFLKPVNKQSKEQLLKEELPPFLKVMNDPRVPALMTAHVELPSFDRQPASLSKKVLSDFLRTELGYSGFVLSDDLEMGAVSQSVDLSEVAVQSLKSGVDAVLVVWDKQKQVQVRDRIAAAILKGELSPQEVEAKLSRIEKLRQRIAAIKNESKSFPSLAFEQKSEMIEQAWANSQSWLLGSETLAKEQLKPQDSRAWTVLVPKGGFSRVWSQFRSQDRILVMDTKNGNYEAYFKVLARGMQSTQPIVVVTPPLHRDGGEWVRGLSKFLAKNYRETRVETPLLWIHLGMQPVRASRIERPLNPLSLVYLNSATTQGLRQFLRMLGSKPHSWNSVSQRYSSSLPSP